MKKYQPKDIEPRWQKKWQETQLYKVDLDNTKEKYYLLIEFTYPSGDLHMGHWFTFAIPDILARCKRMQGFNVFMPNGFDAFGLPAENAAINRGIHPKDWTISNIKTMKKQFATMGASFDWEHEVITCLPNYYKWNQWIFLKMFERDVAYRGKAFSNWCPSCQTVLADENVIGGKCWRCDNEVELKEVEQWFLKITQYADRLVWPDDPKIDWPKAVREGQNNWIGKSEGIEINFSVESSDKKITVYTVFPETIFGVTFMVLAPEHHLVKELTTKEQKQVVEEYIKLSQKKSELERKSLDKDKTGVFTGSYCINQANGKNVPIWVADYVIASYGTGAVMGVPGSDHRDFAFAKKYGLDIIRVIGKTKDDSSFVLNEKDVLEEGFIVNSGEFNGLKTPEPAREKIKDWMEGQGFGQRKINYHLRDWSISRQRYWGTPVPIIHCPKCGLVPVPEKDLPVELPYEVDFTPQGKPPLATVENWVNVKCPKCGGKAKRDVETLDGFFDNSWYFLRYLDPQNDKEIFNKKVTAKWMPVDIYFGGAEHTLGHTLYSRFFVKFLKDLGVLDIEEYALKRVHHGVILGPNGARMSKSHGNVVNPDDQVSEYGTDAVRLYLAFLGPYDLVAPWDSGGISGVYHFLQRIWGLFDKLKIDNGQLTKEDLRMMHKTIKKVTEDIENIKFNTAVAALMEWLNHLSRKDKVSKEEYKIFLLLLAPFAPHMTEELWSILGEEYSIHQQPWPKSDGGYLREAQVKIVIQVNGKVREILVIDKDIESNKLDIEKLALEKEKVKKFLNGKSVKKSVYVKGKLINFVI
ncbi:leucine--tRNA ligase [Candidatus Daviesbacteria bacterium]|nr:leucine--tRNA ligase [Candidatus Daviesbacteria bacterium]